VCWLPLQLQLLLQLHQLSRLLLLLPQLRLLLPPRLQPLFEFLRLPLLPRLLPPQLEFLLLLLQLVLLSRPHVPLLFLLLLMDNWFPCRRGRGKPIRESTFDLGLINLVFHTLKVLSLYCWAHLDPSRGNPRVLVPAERLKFVVGFARWDPRSWSRPAGWEIDL